MKHILSIDPAATPRPKVNTKNGGVWYPANYSQYKAALAWMIKGLRLPKNDYYALEATFYFRYPKGTAIKRMEEDKPHRVKPDADNVIKGLLDALEMAGVMVNDSRICSLFIKKKYTIEKCGRIEFELQTYNDYQTNENIMSKTKQDYFNDLVLIAFRMDEKANRQHERTKRLQRMATLARQGQKESQEFKQLEQEFRQPSVTDFGNEMNDLQRVVKQLKRYKWD